LQFGCGEKWEFVIPTTEKNYADDTLFPTAVKLIFTSSFFVALRQWELQTPVYNDAAEFLRPFGSKRP
jgi:hypothetical protein